MTPQDAAELFNRGRRAVRSLELIRAHRERLRSGTPAGGIPSAVSGGGVSDPTARAANELIAMEDDWSARERACEADITLCRELCRGVGIAFGNLGPEYQIVMEDRYLLCLEWKQIAHALDRSISYVKALKSDACQYVARVGVAAARAGIRKVEA